MARIVFDANVVIALFDSKNVHHDEAVNIYLSSTSSSIHLSSLTYAEILTHPAGQNTLGAFVANLASGGFEVEPISKELAIEIAKVRNETRLKMPDVCVLALAKSLDAELITADRKLATRAKEYKVRTRLLN
ncbi:MAG: PIN domain-containing protein [Rhodoluna sp.]|jgi:predicted nucleic acid-binding protein|nr:PIN domain-containing protein [Rhodoluna sp.]